MQDDAQTVDEALDEALELENEPETTGEIRPFFDTFRELGRGELLDRLDRLQHDIVAAVIDTHREGKITIEIDYKLSGRGQISVRGKCKGKIPEEVPGQSVFFVSPEGNLVRDMPGQGTLFGRRDER